MSTTPPTTTGPQAPAFIRTYIPLAVAALVAWLTDLGVILPDEASTGLAVFLAALAGAAWYAAVRLVEAKWPWAGILLGSAHTPTYAPTSGDGVPVITSLNGTEYANLTLLRDALEPGDPARTALDRVLTG